MKHKIFIILLGLLITIIGCEKDTKVYVQPSLTLICTLTSNNSIELNWTKLNFSQFKGSYRVYRVNYYNSSFMSSDNFGSSTLPMTTISDRSKTSYIDKSFSMYSESTYLSYYVESDNLKSNICYFIIKDGELQPISIKLPTNNTYY